MGFWSSSSSSSRSSSSSMENHLHTLQVMMNEIRNQRVRKNEKIAKSFSFSLLIVVYHVIMMMQKERERAETERESVHHHHHHHALYRLSHFEFFFLRSVYCKLFSAICMPLYPPTRTSSIICLICDVNVYHVRDVWVSASIRWLSCQ